MPEENKDISQSSLPPQKDEPKFDVDLVVSSLQPQYGPAKGNYDDEDIRTSIEKVTSAVRSWERKGARDEEIDSLASGGLTKIKEMYPTVDDAKSIASILREIRRIEFEGQIGSNKKSILKEKLDKYKSLFEPPKE